MSSLANYKSIYKLYAHLPVRSSVSKEWIWRKYYYKVVVVFYENNHYAEDKFKQVLRYTEEEYFLHVIKD